MTDKPLDLMVVGELNVDLILRGNVYPEFGQVEKMVDHADLTIGSSAGIFACGASRLGLKTVITGILGADTFGRFMLENIAGRGIDTGYVRLNRDMQTGLSVILVDVTDRAILTFPGSISELRFEDIDLSVLDQVRHLHLGSYYLLDRLRPDVPRLFEQARQHGVSVSLDTNYDPSEAWDGDIWDALDYTDIFLPNETELMAISREDSVEKGLARISDRVPLVAVKQGMKGASACFEGCLIQADSIQVDVVDTVGAGDSFDAGFVYGYLLPRDIWPIEKVLRLACVCGALSTRAAGGTEAQPSLAEALAYLDPSQE